MFTTIVMAGGSGSRLWPLSRSMFPKQFLALDDKNNNTMLQSTLERINRSFDSEFIIVTNEEHRFIVAEQIRECGCNSKILLEPVGRNTAPAIALAAFHAVKNNNDPILLILPADHIILDNIAFENAIKEAESQAELGYLVTFGIIPTSPETGYGYICRGEQLSDNTYKVENFVEKPNIDLAKQYIDSGKYYWNSGCFMFKASVYLNELKRLSSDIYNICEEIMDNPIQDLDFIRINKDKFLECPDDSVDYAIMEKTDKSVVVTMNAGWSDVGSWSALWEVSDKDENKNVYSGDVIMKNTSGCYIHAPNKLVATVGLQDIVIIDTKDAVLVADRSKVQEVKQVVEQLENEGRKEYQEHREVYHSWGHLDVIDEGYRYKVNRITIKPGESESMKAHYHRAEHWIVVSGTAKVTKGDEVSLLTENQSLYVPVGIFHKVENPGKIDLELIEIQSGSYIDNDDFTNS